VLTTPRQSLRRAAVAFALVSLLAACKRLDRQAGQGEGDASSSDAQVVITDGGDAGGALALVDAAPADDAIPAATSDELSVRARHLLEAIAKDNSDLGSDMLFPRDGWLATRDAADPGKDWDRRVAGPFRRSVHMLSRRHADLDRAQQVTLEIGHTVVQVTPRRHSWKKPLWTVRGSRLTYVVDGHTRTLSIHEMTAWRGAWYVTRLR
jgi:hypothetical protein